MNEYIYDHSPYLGVNTIFNGAQQDANSHHRLRKELAEIYQPNPTADFIMEFMQSLSCCLFVQEKHPNVERALDFAAVFLAQHYQDMEEVLVAVFEFIFKNHSCKTQAVRFRCCEFMNRLLHNMDDQAVLYDDVYEKIASTMLERLQDKVPTIRAQAVMALQRLQVPTDSNCPIMKAFLFHMERDPSPDVRARVVKHVAVTPRVLPILFERIYDVKSTVRKEAFKALSRLRVVKLSIKQRQKICSAGLADKSEPVKSFVLNNMMFTWYKQCDCDYITFLKVLFVETMEEDILEVLLFHLFKKQPSATLFETISGLLNKEKVLPIKSLTPENVTLWLYAVKYMSKSQDGEDMDKDMATGMVPELTKFSKYLKDFSLTLKKGDREKEFIATQLFKLVATYSFDDEMGREQMRVMSINYLMDENIGKDAVPAIVRTFEQLVPSVKDRLVMMAEIISDIREPLLPSQSSAEDGVAEVESQMALLSCSSLDADRVQKTDSETLVKCLTLIIQVFKAKDVTKIDATLLSLKDHFILECFNSPSTEVQCLAQDVMAFFCIWSLDIAKENFLKFCFQLSNDGTCYSALGGIIDILLVHGFHPFSLNNASARKPNKGAVSLDDLSNDPTLTPSQVFLISLLVDLLNNESPAIRARACQGLAKLMICGHLSSSLILARLILIWFSPSSASEPEIRQPLGIFLNMFSTKRPLAGEIILNCILPP
uniref:Condensin complex subunit 3 n=1 Tax=Lygus hesperus TaxID=30085 RepID=A0A0A9WEY1_LYGHE